MSREAARQVLIVPTTNPLHLDFAKTVRFLCRGLCRNPSIPTGIGPSRCLSLDNRLSTVKTHPARIKTASSYHSAFFGVASSRTVSRFDTVEVWGSSPHGPTTSPLVATVYILQSESTGRYYVGSTTDLKRRLSEHGRDHTPSTRNRGPWKLVHREEYATLLDARRREAEIKRWKSSKLIAALIARSVG